MFKKLLTLFLFFYIEALSADVYVICHPNVTLDSLTANEIKRIFLGKTRTFPNGASVRAIDQEYGTESRETFYQNVIRKSETWLKVYWSRKTLTGRGVSPRRIASDELVKEIVANDPLMLGYIDSRFVDSRVKVLYKISD